jgi:hypothetical protein
MSHTFTLVEEELSIPEQRLGKQQMKDNIELYEQRSEKDDDGEIGLAVAGNTRWEQTGSRMNYNSDRGCQLITGCLSKKVLAACCMSCQCAKCESKNHMTTMYAQRIIMVA